MKSPAGGGPRKRPTRIQIELGEHHYGLLLALCRRVVSADGECIVTFSHIVRCALDALERELDRQTKGGESND